MNFRQERQMNGYLAYGAMQMARGAFVRLEHAKGVLFRVRDGELWITQEGDRRDYYVKAGESFRLDRDGTALACALRASRVSLSSPTTAAL